ncbi:MAG: hypothetical protein R8L53_02645, partial [Mariprofundales bacterium]
YTSNFEAGTFHSVGVVGGAVAADSLLALQTRVASLQAEIAADNYANINRESVLGDMFYAGTLGYFAMYQSLSSLQAQTAGVNHLLMPSFGTYGIAARVNYFFGFPRTMSAGGIVMDIGKLITTTTPKNGNNDERFSFVLQAGLLSSALEHTVPEQMFSTTTQKAEAVSTVKLLNIAAQQGMPILHITSANKSTTIPSLQLAPEVINEIQAAVSVGKEVIAHQRNITAFGWTGAGYVIFDPVTGDGAWRISGGGNGGVMTLGGASLAVLGFFMRVNMWISGPIALQMILHGGLLFGLDLALSFNNFNYISFAVSIYVSFYTMATGMSGVGSFLVGLITSFIMMQIQPYIERKFKVQ